MIFDLTPEEAYEEARKKGYDERYEDVIWSSSNPRFAYKFARDIKGANVKDLQQIIETEREPVFAFLFARDVPKADIEILQDIAMDDPETAYAFAKDIESADIDKLFDVVEGTEWESDFKKNVYNRTRKESFYSKKSKMMISEEVSKQKIDHAIDKASSSALNMLYKNLGISMSIDKARKFQDLLANHIGEALKEFFA